ncbi:MAG: D-alanyl-D-alanine carboxypeptidase family protein [Candidatus Onthoplasma sp.]
MKKKLFIFFALIVMVSCLFMTPIKEKTVYAVGSSAKAMCVIEKDSQRVIYSKNQDEKLPMASTTKIMTAITVIQNCQNLQELIQVDDSAVGVSGTSIYLRQGEELTVEDLLYGLMLRSGNDAAVALACNISGSEKEFANLMNNMAKKIGAKNSHFSNPHGLDNPEHYTTAYDLALITSYALNNPIFKKIVSTKSHVIEATNKSDKRYLTNKNKLLSKLESCCGVKTGFTSKAGRCLVSAIEQNETIYVCVVLNCGPMFEESSNLLTSASNEYRNRKIIDKNKEIFNEYIIDNNNGRLYLYANEDFSYPLTDAEMDKIKLEYHVKLDNAEIGDEVGEIKVFFDNHLIKTVKLITMNKIDKLIDSKTLNISEILWEETNENK